MSEQELNEMQSELDASEPDPIKEGDPEFEIFDEPVTPAAASDDLPFDPGIQATVSMLVTGIGAAICDRAHVARLDQDEIGTLSTATAQLLFQYDVEIANPKTKAWIGFGGALAMTAGSRYLIAIDRKKLEPEPERAGDPEPETVHDREGDPVGYDHMAGIDLTNEAEAEFV